MKYKELYENEMRMKNEAYSFIISKGLLKEFNSWQLGYRPKRKVVGFRYKNKK